MSRNTLSYITAVLRASRQALLGCALALGTVAAGCNGGDPQALQVQLGKDPFVPIPKGPNDVAAKAAAVGQYALTSGPSDTSQAGAGNDFYIAINTSELGNRWFLSGYMKQFFPGAVSSGAASSVGVKVVTFAVQNGRLYVIDADSRKTTSDTFDPTVLVEAYPLVKNYGPFNSLPGSENYVLFDPSAGLNQFAFLADLFAEGSNPVPFQVDLSYMQGFRKISDGVTYEQVFMGYTPTGGPDSSGVEVNSLRASGTLGLALRRYTEDSHYTPSDLPSQVYYFMSDPSLVPNSPGYIDEVPIKWPIYKGMKPIQWVISEQVNSKLPIPYFDLNGNPITIDPTKYDIYGAIKAGIENWNLAFGFPALQARMGTPADTYSNDDENYLIYDLDTSFGAAFANWRSNPNTGEIRGASVYFSALWTGEAVNTFDWPQATGMAQVGGGNGMAKPIPRVPGLVWQPMQQKAACVMWPQGYGHVNDGAPVDPGIIPAAATTPKQQVEGLITHIVFHEIGHTLGLRHNFKGSLTGTPMPTDGQFQASSVMDYTEYHDALSIVTAGTYDQAAINWLYNPAGGMQPNEPTDAFCNDSDVGVDPDCRTYDRYASPLTSFWNPSYQSFLVPFIKGTSGNQPNNSLNNVLTYVRAGRDAPTRLSAFHLAYDQVKVGVTTCGGAACSFPAVDAMAHEIFQRLYLDPAGARGAITNDPPADAGLIAVIIPELQGNLVNTDGHRSFGTRRAMVDVLKHMQSLDAFRALMAAQTTIAASIGGLTGDAKLQTQDLLARVTAAVSPYFAN